MEEEEEGKGGEMGGMCDEGKTRNGSIEVEEEEDKGEEMGDICEKGRLRK